MYCRSIKTICDCANALADIERDLETFEEHLEGTYGSSYVRILRTYAYARTNLFITILISQFLGFDLYIINTYQFYISPFNLNYFS